MLEGFISREGLKTQIRQLERDLGGIAAGSDTNARCGLLRSRRTQRASADASVIENEAAFPALKQDSQKIQDTIKARAAAVAGVNQNVPDANGNIAFSIGQVMSALKQTENIKEIKKRDAMTNKTKDNLERAAK
jgi:hypothetical protein